MLESAHGLALNPHRRKKSNNCYAQRYTQSAYVTHPPHHYRPLARSPQAIKPRLITTIKNVGGFYTFIWATHCYLIIMCCPDKQPIVNNK